MKKIVVASDSFKGTLSSLKICELFKNEIDPNSIDLVTIPIADGGEGSLDCIASILPGYYVDVEVFNLYCKEMTTRFYVDRNLNAYIETASCVGLTLAKENNDPGRVTTYGLGEQIKKAIDLGARNIYIFLGGSASNDGGCGLASSLDTKFYDRYGYEFIPTGLELDKIAKIDNKRTKAYLYGINIYALCDVRSPFYGIEGAAYKFAPQKGATKEEVVILDNNLKHLASQIKKDLNIEIDNVEGSGAAGGLGGGLLAFCNAKIVSGINTILDLINFNEIISNCDLVISGEGKLDRQTYDGKVIDGIHARCKQEKKPLSLIVGISEVTLDTLNKDYPYVNKIYETNYQHLPFNKVKDKAEESYIEQIHNLIKDINLV